MIRSFLSFCLSFLRTTTQLRLENLFLRKQMEILARTSSRPRLRSSDRFFFSTMTNVFGSWKETLLVIKPETVIRWHRQSFRLYWRWKSRSEAGRPKIPQAQIDLIRQMANDNALWGAPRIHGEMLKWGFDLSEATVQRYMPKRPQRTTRQRWKTFLKNHSVEIISLDFFVVPTITFKLLHVLVFLSHDRRRIIHFNVTDHPTAEWASQQLRNAFCDIEPLKFLIRDRDKTFGGLFTDTVEGSWHSADLDRVPITVAKGLRFILHLVCIDRQWCSSLRRVCAPVSPYSRKFFGRRCVEALSPVVEAMGSHKFPRFPVFER